MKTLEQHVANMEDGKLLDIFEELASGIVPASGAARGYCRLLNRMVDTGNLCINQATYRKIYLPTLAKTVQMEMSRRYANILTKKR